MKQMLTKLKQLLHQRTEEYNQLLDSDTKMSLEANGAMSHTVREKLFKEMFLKQKATNF